MHSSVEGSKRQLPPWMMPKIGPNNVSKSEKAVETNCSLEKGKKFTEDDGNGTEENAGTVHKSETSKRKSNSDAKCEVKRVRNPSQEGGSIDDVVQKKKKKGYKSSNKVRKSSRKKQQILEDPGWDNCDVNTVQASNDDDDDDDDDVELTVEDLMVIAKRYVKDHEDNKRQEISTRHRESQWQLPARNETGTTIDSSLENTKSSSCSRETLSDSRPTTTGEVSAASTTKTVNHGLDILDMFFSSINNNPL